MDRTPGLKIKALNGSVWSLLEKVSMLLVSFIVGIILARLLSPEDYGLVALTIIFTTISAAITDGGFEKSLINKQQLTPVQINTVFYINIILGFSMMLFLIVVAPFISVFFNEPDLTNVLRFVSLGIFINAIGQTPSALLRKELNFKKVSYAHMSGSLLGGVLGIFLAYNDYGVWALVFSALASQVIILIGYLISSSWYPKLQFSYSSVKPMLPYGLNVLFSSSISFTIQQFNSLIIGKFYSKTDLGLFHRGGRLPEMITSVIEGVVLKMAFPLFSKVHHDNDHLLSILQKTIKTLAFITFPLLVFLMFNARDITIVLFTKKWEGSIIYLELFCIVKLFYPFIIIYKEILLAKGYAQTFTKLVTIFSIMEVILVLVFAKFGIIYILLSTLFSVLIQYITYIKVVSEKIDLAFWKQIVWLKKYIALSGMLILTIMISDRLLFGLDDVLYLKLIIKMGIAFFSYIIFAYSLKVDEIDHFNFFYRSVLNRLSKQSI